MIIGIKIPYLDQPIDFIIRVFDSLAFWINDRGPVAHFSKAILVVLPSLSGQ